MAASEAQFTWRGFWIAFLISLGQLAAGYPSALIGTTLGEPSFLVYMGLYTKGATGSFTPTTKITQLIGAMNGVYQAGAVIGVLGAPYIMDRWGRRAGFVYASTFSILGGAIVTGSNGVAMFITARFFVGLGAWAFVAITPTYTAEVAPPRLRGFFVGLNGVCVTLGYGLGKPLQTSHCQTLASHELTEAPAAYMGMAFYYAPYGEVQWRVPLGLALGQYINIRIIISNLGTSIMGHNGAFVLTVVQCFRSQCLSSLGFCQSHRAGCCCAAG